MKSRTEIEAELRRGRVGIIPRMQQVEVRDVDDKGRRLFARAVPYDVEIDLGWYLESMAPGVFAKSIQESARDLPLLLFHQADSLDTIVGRVERWEDKRAGLDGVWLFDDSDEARRAADKADSGSLGFMSVGFIPVAGEQGSTFEWDAEDRLHVRRKEARLLEVSLTPTPAYNAAAVTKVRDRPAGVSSAPRLTRWREYLSSVR